VTRDLDRPRALDLFCGAGGVSMGLHRAGFDVTGVDISPQPSYPFEFRQGDALEADLAGFDFVWASPPCQRYIRGGLQNTSKTVDLLGPVRDRLSTLSVPWAIENVPGAPMRPDLVLCGSAFGLSVRRHRWFELSWPVAALLPPCDHSQPIVGVYGNPHGEKGAWPGMLPSTIETWSEAMGIDWMTAKELSQAIPPAYSEFIARLAVSWLRRTVDLMEAMP
jgi:DNA (cytosine-5)-methyltransferase 1